MFILANKSKRLKYNIEFIRLVAVILITFTHTRNDLESGALYFIFEQIPTFGTAILSAVSGYLYVTKSRFHKNLLDKKIKSLVIPYLIANISVFILVLIANYFGYNALNRLTFDYKLITEGILSLNSPPINPPTYFIRDIFILFCFIILLTKRDLRTLFFIVPFLLFGTVMLKTEIAFLFMTGMAYGYFKDKVKLIYLHIFCFTTTLIFGLYNADYIKIPIAFWTFISIINLNFKFYKTGRFSYLLHLYHAPIIVTTYPFLSRIIHKPLYQILSQIIISIIIVYALFLLTKRFNFLKILSGGR